MAAGGKAATAALPAMVAAAVAHVGFWVALGVCGELWEVRLGSCNGDVSRQHKNKTRKLNIFHFD